MESQLLFLEECTAAEEQESTGTVGDDSVDYDATGDSGLEEVSILFLSSTVALAGTSWGKFQRHSCSEYISSRRIVRSNRDEERGSQLGEVYSFPPTKPIFQDLRQVQSAPRRAKQSRLSLFKRFMGKG